MMRTGCRPASPQVRLTSTVCPICADDTAIGQASLARSNDGPAFASVATLGNRSSVGPAATGAVTGVVTGSLGELSSCSARPSGHGGVGDGAEGRSPDASAPAEMELPVDAVRQTSGEKEIEYRVAATLGCAGGRGQHLSRLRSLRRRGFSDHQDCQWRATRDDDSDGASVPGSRWHLPRPDQADHLGRGRPLVEDPRRTTCCHHEFWDQTGACLHRQGVLASGAILAPGHLRRHPRHGHRAGQRHQDHRPRLLLQLAHPCRLSLHLRFMAPWPHLPGASA